MALGFSQSQLPNGFSQIQVPSHHKQITPAAIHTAWGSESQAAFLTFLRLMLLFVALLTGQPGCGWAMELMETTWDHLRGSSEGGDSHGGFRVSVLSWGYPNSWMVYFMENPITMDDD